MPASPPTLQRSCRPRGGIVRSRNLERLIYCPEKREEGHMKHSDISRRQFARIAGTGAASRLGAASALTARDVAQTVQSALGGDWPATGLDGFKAGDASTAV